MCSLSEQDVKFVRVGCAVCHSEICSWSERAQRLARCQSEIGRKSGRRAAQVRRPAEMCKRRVGFGYLVFLNFYIGEGEAGGEAGERR